MIFARGWATRFAILVCLSVVTRASDRSCLPSGDQVPINKLLSEGGPGVTVNLCAGSVHHLTAPIVLTAEHQTITTEGEPLDHLRAELVVTGEDQAVAIQGDCQECSWATIRSLIINGNRPNLLRVKDGQALVWMGNAEGQVVRDCRLFETRGWTAIHFREGDRKQCSRGHVHHNVIGPNGEEWDEEYDDRKNKGWPEVVRYGSPVSDGVSLACKDSIVENNTIFDCTDGLIVVFGSPGSEIRYNTLYAKTRLVQGAVNLVDIPPWEGDYTNTRVHHNTINAYSRFMRTAIAVGRSTWDDEVNEAIYGGRITHNTLGGAHFGYGIVASTCRDFTITDNVVLPDAVFSGMTSPRCPTSPPNSPPKAFLYNKGSVESSTLQSDFVNGEVQFIICVDMLTDNGIPSPPRRFRDSPLAIAQREEENKRLHPEKYKTHDEGVDDRVAEALVSYQMNLVAAMNGIQLRSPNEAADDLAKISDVDPEMLDLANSVTALEDSRGLLIHNMLDMASDVAGLKVMLQQHKERQRGHLEGLRATLHMHPADAEVHTSTEDTEKQHPLTTNMILFAGGVFATATLLGCRRLQQRRAHHAALKIY